MIITQDHEIELMNTSDKFLQNSIKQHACSIIAGNLTTSRQSISTNQYVINLDFTGSCTVWCHYIMCTWSCLSLVDCDPVCCGKPFVALDVIDSVLQVAVTFGQIHLQQVSQQIFQVRAEVGGESYLGRSKF